jgi:hypothetical protein
MKRVKGIAMTSLGIILLNLIAGLACPRYDVFGNILLWLSYLSVAVMFILLFSNSRVPLVVFSMAVLFGLSGLVLIAVSFFSDDLWRVNILVLGGTVLTALEAVVILLAYFYWKERKRSHGGFTKDTLTSLQHGAGD